MGVIRSIADPRIDAAIARARSAHMHPSPPDWRAHWIYFLLLDRFDNPERPPASPWNAETFAPQGGTFDGVRRRLAYIRDLGAGAIWLSPFLKEREFCYGYGPQNFLAVDPRYGTEDDLARLVDEAHARGLYVIADVVMHHAGEVFVYGTPERSARFAESSETPYPIAWRDEHGAPRWSQAPLDCADDAAVWPIELRQDGAFRRQGGLNVERPVRGDLYWLREFDPSWCLDRTVAHARVSVQDVLVRIYQYWIARLDLDGFRLDSLKHVERGVARRFCTEIREFAAGVGKTNFLLLGEVRGGIDEISSYLGKEPGSVDGQALADAAILFPASQALRDVATRDAGCGALRRGHGEWARSLSRRCGRSGDPVSYMVTMLDDHDTTSRFFDGTSAGAGDLLLALAWQFTSPGIPCLYYGTEQGLHGRSSDAAMREEWLFEGVREALWGKPDAFDPRHPFCQFIKGLSALRARHPALAFGRTYWRPLSEHGRRFSLDSNGAVLAFARVHGPDEMLIAANWHRTERWTGYAIVDADRNVEGAPWTARASTLGVTTGNRSAVTRVQDASVCEEGGPEHVGVAVSALHLRLAPREIVVYARGE